jgi:hypothetical protein
MVPTSGKEYNIDEPIPKRRRIKLDVSYRNVMLKNQKKKEKEKEYLKWQLPYAGINLIR